MTTRAVAAALIALALPAAAQAATVSVYVPPCTPEQSKRGQCYPDEARFVAQPGEQNNVTIAHVSGSSPMPRLRITDAGAALTAGAGCTQVDGHSATCTGRNILADVDTGDGDDTVRGPGILHGGNGADTLNGGSAEYGGPGDDTLSASDFGTTLEGDGGRDRITGGAGSDNIVDAGEAGERDVVDGGGSSDTMSYGRRKSPVAVSLVNPSANEDQLTSIENLNGGSGSDTLTGNGARNVLGGGPGADRLAGGAGDDTLDGGTGADTLAGGRDDDKLAPGADKARNLIGCGTGSDRAEPTATTLIAADCELIGLEDFFLNGRVFLRLPPASSRAPVLRMEPLACIHLPCQVRLTLRSMRGAMLGRSVATQRHKHPRLPKRITLRLNAAGRKALRAPGARLVRIGVRYVEKGEPTTAAFLAAL